MVYKTEKHGVRTGNTFKRWNNKYLRNYARHSYLVRSHINKQAGPEVTDFEDIVEFGKTSALGEGDSMTDGVEYSLNKQARWELPNILENKILFEDNVEDYGIELVERHRITLMANCINVCSTNGLNKDGKINKDRRSLCKNRGGYCQSNSVLKTSNKPKKNRRRRRAPEVEHTVDDDEPEIHAQNKLRYEVFHPVPTESYLCHVDKKIGNDTSKKFIWNGYQDKQQRCKKYRRISNDIRESLACMDDAFDDSDEENVHHETGDIFDDGDKLDYHVTVEDILLHANTANKLASNKSRHYSDSSVSSAETSSAKGHVVYIESSDDTIENDTDSTTGKVSETASKNVSSTILEPVHAILANDTITPKVLADTYGKHFIECECFPRKFILNISHRVNQLKCFTSHSKTSFHTEVCLVFVHDADNEINNQEENVYKLFLNANMSGNISSLRIETIFDYVETNVEELIERSLFFIETLPEESLVCENDSNPYRKLMRQTPLEQCANWSTNPYNPDNDFLFDYFISRTPDVKEAVEMGYELVTRLDLTTDDNSDNIGTTEGQFCYICYSALEVSSPGTALIACSHWFCDMCWKEYLETRIMDGALTLKCPEFDCNNSVDSGTVLSLINLRDVIKHTQHCHDTDVEQQVCTKWCPNKTCGRVLKINDVNMKNCRCLCGLKMCFDCLDPPHWPASCESVRKYYKKLRDSGDISLEPPEVRSALVVRGKPCPSCHRFFEKNGGCPYMTCLCKAAFCWGCGQLWQTRTHGSECYNHGYNDAHGTSARTFAQTNILDNKNRQKWYKMALIHRVNQHPGRIHTLKMAVKPLSKKIQGYVFSAERSGKPVALNFDISDKTFDREYEKAPYLVTSTVDLYSEINHVIENTSVLLISEELTDANSIVLKHITRRLSSFSDSIYELFKHHTAIHAEVVVYKLTEVRFHSKKTMQSLIRCIQSMKL